MERISVVVAPIRRGAGRGRAGLRLGNGDRSGRAGGREGGPRGRDCAWFYRVTDTSYLTCMATGNAMQCKGPT